MTEAEIKRILEAELKHDKHSKDKHAFCRYHLKEVMKDVKKQVPVEIRKTACVMGDYGHYSFYINYPKVRFHASVEGCCKWAARAAGWSKYPGKFEDDADELNGSI
jgi:hypothetical protein